MDRLEERVFAVLEAGTDADAQGEALKRGLIYQGGAVTEKGRTFLRTAEALREWFDKAVIPGELPPPAEIRFFDRKGDLKGTAKVSSIEVKTVAEALPVSFDEALARKLNDALAQPGGREAVSALFSLSAPADPGFLSEMQREPDGSLGVFALIAWISGAPKTFGACVATEQGPDGETSPSSPLVIESFGTVSFGRSTSPGRELELEKGGELKVKEPKAPPFEVAECDPCDDCPDPGPSCLECPSKKPETHLLEVEACGSCRRRSSYKVTVRPEVPPEGIVAILDFACEACAGTGTLEIEEKAFNSLALRGKPRAERFRILLERHVSPGPKE